MAGYFEVVAGKLCLCIGRTSSCSLLECNIRELRQIPLCASLLSVSASLFCPMNFLTGASLVKKRRKKKKQLSGKPRDATKWAQQLPLWESHLSTTWADQHSQRFCFEYLDFGNLGLLNTMVSVRAYAGIRLFACGSTRLCMKPPILTWAYLFVLQHCTRTAYFFIPAWKNGNENHIQTMPHLIW